MPAVVRIDEGARAIVAELQDAIAWRTRSIEAFMLVVQNPGVEYSFDVVMKSIEEAQALRLEAEKRTAAALGALALYIRESTHDDTEELF